MAPATRTRVHRAILPSPVVVLAKQRRRHWGSRGEGLVAFQLVRLVASPANGMAEAYITILIPPDLATKIKHRSVSWQTRSVALPIVLGEQGILHV